MKPNVLFVNLPYRPPEGLLGGEPGESISQASPLTMPMGILLISSYLKAHNDVGRVGLLDYRLSMDRLGGYRSAEEFFREEARKNAPFVPDILAVSLTFSLTHRTFELAAKQLKQLWPQATLIVGGNHATNATTAVLEIPEVDYVLRGEGEIGFSEFVRQWSGERPVRVQGVYARGQLKAGRPDALAQPVEDLDALPFPDWDLLDLERYLVRGRRRTYGEEGSASRAATILSTRGCPFHCAFCSNHTVHGRKVRARSAESVAREVRTLHERYGVTLFLAEDDLFTADKQRLIRILEALQRLNIPGFELQMGNGLSVNGMDEDILDALVKVGIRSVTFAIESGSEHVQRHVIRKNVNLRKAYDVVRWSHERGLIVRAFIMLGFPGETRELIAETVRYMRDLGADWYAINIVQPLLGTETYDAFVRQGCFEDGPEAWSANSCEKRQFDTPEISGAGLTHLAYRINLEVNFLSNVNLRNGNSDRAIALFDNIVRLYPFHVFACYGLHLAHQAKGDAVESARALRRMRELIAENPLAREMYENYGYLIPADPKPACG